MRPKKHVALTLILLGTVGVLMAEERMSLEESIRLAVRSNQGIRIAGEGVTGAQWKIGESKSLYYPQVGLSASYTRISLVSEFTLTLNGVPTTFNFMSPNSYSLKLSATEQLFNWGRTARTVELSRIGVDLARNGLDQSRQAVAYQVIPQFYGVLFLRSAIEVIDETLLLFEKRLDIARKRYQAGLASRFDISLLQVQIGSLQGQKLDFQNNVSKLAFAFNRLCGRPMDAPFVPAGNLVYESMALNRQQILDRALSGRLEVRQLLQQENLSQTQIDLAKTGNKPNLVLSFNYQLGNGVMPYVDQLRGYWTATIAAAYPVFDGSRTRAQVAQAVAALQQVRGRKEDLKQAITMEIENDMSDIQTLERKLEIEKVKIGHAEEALSIAAERFQNALINTTDLIEAQNSLAGARLNYLQLVYNHILARYNLYRAIGQTLFE